MQTRSKAYFHISHSFNIIFVHYNILIWHLYTNKYLIHHTGYTFIHIYRTIAKADSVLFDGTYKYVFICFGLQSSRLLEHKYLYAVSQHIKAH